MESINVYARAVDTRGEGDQVSVFLKSVDPEQVIKEFNPTVVLDALDWADIMDYVAQQRAEAEDE